MLAACASSLLSLCSAEFGSQEDARLRLVDSAASSDACPQAMPVCTRAADVLGALTDGSWVLREDLCDNCWSPTRHCCGSSRTRVLCHKRGAAEEKPNLFWTPRRCGIVLCVYIDKHMFCCC